MKNGRALVTLLVFALGRFCLLRYAIPCRIALTIMIFVNSGGGGYYFFKHARWNGENLSSSCLLYFLNVHNY